MMKNPYGTPRDSYSLAITAILRGRKGELRLTYLTIAAQVAVLTPGAEIKLRQLKAVMNDDAPLTVNDLICLSRALDLDPVDVLTRIL